MLLLLFVGQLLTIDHFYKNLHRSKPGWLLASEQLVPDQRHQRQRESRDITGCPPSGRPIQQPTRRHGDQGQRSIGHRNPQQWRSGRALLDDAGHVRLRSNDEWERAFV